MELQFHFQTKRNGKVLTTILFYGNLSTKQYNYDMIAFIYFYLHMQCPIIDNNDIRVKLIELPLFTTTPQKIMYKFSHTVYVPYSGRVIHPQPIKYIDEIIIIHMKDIISLHM